MAIQGLTALCMPPNAFGSLSVDSVIKRITFITTVWHNVLPKKLQQTSMPAFT